MSGAPEATPPKYESIPMVSGSAGEHDRAHERPKTARTIESLCSPTALRLRAASAVGVVIDVPDIRKIRGQDGVAA
jgi:hypothetical protein